MKYISHKVLYTMLPKAIREMPDSELDNMIIQCIRQIDALPMYENKLTLVQVNNGVAELPADFIKSWGVFYSSKEPSQSEMESLLGCIDGDIEGFCLSDSVLTGSTQTNNPALNDVTPTIGEPPAWADRYKLVPILRPSLEDPNTDIVEYIFKNVTYSNYLQTDYHQNCWTPLYMSDKMFTGCYTDKDSPCWNSECDYRYSIDKCGHVLTTFKNGWLKLAYLGRPTHDDGSYLIPDNQEYFRVLRDGVIMMYWEEERFSHTDAAIHSHREYQRYFYNGVAALRGSALLPKGIDKDRALRNIIYADLNIANDYSQTGNAGWSGGTLYPHMRPKFRNTGNPFNDGGA